MISLHLLFLFYFSIRLFQLLPLRSSLGSLWIRQRRYSKWCWYFCRSDCFLSFYGVSPDSSRLLIGHRWTSHRAGVGFCKPRATARAEWRSKGCAKWELALGRHFVAVPRRTVAAETLIGLRRGQRRRVELGASRLRRLPPPPPPPPPSPSPPPPPPSSFSIRLALAEIRRPRPIDPRRLTLLLSFLPLLLLLLLLWLLLPPPPLVLTSSWQRTPLPPFCNEKIRTKLSIESLGRWLWSFSLDSLGKRNHSTSSIFFIEASLMLFRVDFVIATTHPSPLFYLLLFF